MEPIFHGEIKRGEVLLKQKDKFIEYLRTLNGKEIELIVRRLKKQRSNQQNRWYWSCVVGIAAEHFGYTKEEMHEAYKLIFLRRIEDNKPETVRSTTSLSTKSFGEYCEQCRQWCAEHDIYIPDPGEVDLKDED